MSTSSLPDIEDGWVLSGLAVDNLRALRMPEPLPLRRLMLVVGRNGIGKSTLTRVFPLLGQSAGDRTREPILWWSRNGVDFGSFGEALRRGQSALTFGFEFSHPQQPTWRATSTLAKGPEGCRVSRVEVLEDDHAFTATFDEAGQCVGASTRIDGDTLDWAGADEPCQGLGTDPWRLFAIGQREVSKSALLEYFPADIGRARTDVLSQGLLAELYGYPGIEWAHLREFGLVTEHEKPPDELWRQRDPSALVRELRSRIDFWPFESGDRSVAASMKRWDPSSDDLRHIRHHLFFHYGLGRVRHAERLIDRLTPRMAYIGPFRAIPERDYRHQSVAVEALDPRGENLAMFIGALEPAEQRDLNRFLEQSLDFGIKLDRRSGRYTLRIRLEGQDYNLLDVGFGYSQVLPVAVQLWAAGRVLSTSRSRERTLLLAIEQPELHLHPHHQVLVGRALAASAMAENGPMQLVETHSDHLVSEIGLLVARGQLDPERVGVLCIEPHGGKDDGAAVRLATFDADGVLQNWPAGFLAP